MFLENPMKILSHEIEAFHRIKNIGAFFKVYAILCLPAISNQISESEIQTVEVGGASTSLHIHKLIVKNSQKGKALGICCRRSLKEVIAM